MNSNYVIIGQNPKTKDFWFHERENNNGKPGKVICMGDGRGDLKGTVDWYVEKGFDPSKIIINGQPASDVFEKSVK